MSATCGLRRKLLRQVARLTVLLLFAVHAGIIDNPFSADFVSAGAFRQSSSSSSSPPRTDLQGPPVVYAVFSADSEGLAYALAAPMSAYVWRHALNVTPILFLGTNLSSSDGHTGDPHLTPLERHIVRSVKKIGGKVHCLQAAPGDRLSTTLQVARLAAHSLEYIREEDVVLTADADIWPLDPAFWTPVLRQLRGFGLPPGAEMQNSTPPQDGSLRGGPETRVGGATNARVPFWIYNGPFFAERYFTCDFAAISFLAASRRAWTYISERFRASEPNLPEERVKRCPGYQPPLPPISGASSPALDNFTSPPAAGSKQSTFLRSLAFLMSSLRRAYGSELWAGGLAADVRSHRAHPVWYADQIMSGELLRHSGACNNGSTVICVVNQDVRRLDRGKWLFDGAGAWRRYTDVHLPSFVGLDGWAKGADVWDDMFGLGKHRFAEEYRERALQIVDGRVGSDAAVGDDSVVVCDPM